MGGNGMILQVNGFSKGHLILYRLILPNAETLIFLLLQKKNTRRNGHDPWARPVLADPKMSKWERCKTPKNKWRPTRNKFHRGCPFHPEINFQWSYGWARIPIIGFFAPTKHATLWTRQLPVFFSWRITCKVRPLQDVSMVAPVIHPNLANSSPQQDEFFVAPVAIPLKNVRKFDEFVWSVLMT